MFDDLWNRAKYLFRGAESLITLYGKDFLDWSIPSVISCYFFLLFFQSKWLILMGVVWLLCLCQCIRAGAGHCVTGTFKGTDSCTIMKLMWFSHATPQTLSLWWVPWVDAVIRFALWEVSVSLCCIHGQTRELIFHDVSPIWIGCVFMGEKLRCKKWAGGD